MIIWLEGKLPMSNGMSREVIVFILGILLLLVPQLGIPDSWKLYFYIVAGVILIVVGYSLRRSAYLRSIDQGNGERSTESYVESTRNIDWPEESTF